MKGIVLGLVRETLHREFGAGPWTALPGGPSANGGRVPGTRDSAGEARGAGADARGAEAAEAEPSDALLCWMGRRAFRGLSARVPGLLRNHADLRAFVASLEAEGEMMEEPPTGESDPVAVAVTTTPDGDLLVSVRGHPGLCALLEGVVGEAARTYAEPAALERLKCRRRGDNLCLFRVALEEAGALVPVGEGGSGWRAAGLG